MIIPHEKYLDLRSGEHVQSFRRHEKHIQILSIGNKHSILSTNIKYGVQGKSCTPFWGISSTLLNCLYFLYYRNHLTGGIIFRNKMNSMTIHIFFHFLMVGISFSCSFQRFCCYHWSIRPYRIYHIDLPTFLYNFFCFNI